MADDNTQKTLTPDGYISRLIDKRINFLLDTIGAVEITGAKWCGKTWTALAHSESAISLDDRSVLMRVTEAPETALRGAQPHLIDEWQELSFLWDDVRRAVDSNASRAGQFILTGSTQLKIKNSGSSQEKEVHHSGAGRIKRVSMWPMTLVEEGISNGQVSLYGLFQGEFECSDRNTNIDDVIGWCCKGGWPANMNRSYEKAAETTATQLENLYDISIPSLGLNPDTAANLINALALNLAQPATLTTLAKDMSGGDEDNMPARSTIERYLDVLRRLFIIYEVKGWDAPLRAKNRVRVKPKRYFVDPSLAAIALKATPERLLDDMQTLGNLFETLVMRDLNAFVSTYPGIGNEVRYFRDQNGLEVDAILEVNGQWAAIEIKLSETKADEAATALLRLREKTTENPMARIPEPAFLAVVVGRGSMAYRRNDGVYVIPAATLTA